MLRQIKWWLQNEPTTKNGVFPVTTLFFWKLCFGLGTSYKELTCCTSSRNAHICTFCKCWNFIWRCFFPVSSLKQNLRIILDILSQSCVLKNNQKSIITSWCITILGLNLMMNKVSTNCGLTDISLHFYIKPKQLHQPIKFNFSSKYKSQHIV